MTRFVDIAALESGGFELRTSDIDLAVLATREARRISSDADRIRVDAPETVPVHADLGRLALVVSGLLDNALKFGGQEPVTLRVRRDGTGGLVQVGDRGPGLEPEDRESVFRPSSASASRRGTTAGSGSACG